MRLFPFVIFPNEEAETESYLSINTLQLNGNSGSKVPEIVIAYDEDFVTQNMPIYFNNLYFYNCNVKILEA